MKTNNILDYYSSNIKIASIGPWDYSPGTELWRHYFKKDFIDIPKYYGSKGWN